MASLLDGIKTSRVSPRFLHGNATSHTWIFSAFAELIDNAYDPDVNASELWIDVRKINNTDCICFVDNGNGMNPDKLHKMLSFGYCEKVAVGNLKPIGFYGNGFKSGSMRIGKDVLVLTRSTTSMSVGMLSQTYLTAVNAEAVVVPIVTFDLPSKLRQSTPESLSNMKAIMRHSLFQSEHQLITELKALERMETGTIIIIYNIKKDDLGNYEIDFESDKNDLRNPETQMIDLTSINRPINQSSPEYKRSLREYCSILYLKPRMKIRIRGQKVLTKLISKSLSKTEVDVYKPSWLPRPVRLTFGFTSNKESENYGLMMYHKNRLIKAYEKIGCQKQANTHGIGVVGVVEANFLEPIHNKQDFNRTDKYSAFMLNVSMKLNDYFFEKTQHINPDIPSISEASKLSDWTWAQCDNCLRWRRLPTGYNKALPDKWFCRMNPDAAFNRCDIQEEPEDDDEALQPTYRKTYKKTQEEKKRKIKLEEERKLREKEEELKEKERHLQQKLKQVKKIAKQQKELAEVSSSQDKVDRKPTLADLEKARISITSYQRQVLEKEQTIKQLEQQQKQVEEKSRAMLHMADQLKLSTEEGSNLYEKIQEMSGLGSSTVTSSSGSSHGLRAPKRKHDMVADKSEPGFKMIKIKTEDGGSELVKVKESVIDLTLDENDEELTEDTTGPATENVNDSEPNEDNKPDNVFGENDICNKNVETNKDKDNIETNKDKDNIETNTDKDNEETNKDIDSEETNKDKVEEETDEDKNQHKDTVAGTDDTLDTSNVPEIDDGLEKTDNKHGERSQCSDISSGSNTGAPIIDDIKPDKIDLDKKITEMIEEKKVLVENFSQTVPTIVKFASPEEVDLLKLSPVEQKAILLLKARELDETKKGMASLQENIWKLLKLIVPDFDYGEPGNIEKIIIDFIKVNEEQENQ